MPNSKSTNAEIRAEWLRIEEAEPDISTEMLMHMVCTNLNVDEVRVCHAIVEEQDK